MSKKKQDVQVELDKILQPESELEPSGSGIVESLNNIDQVIQEFESEKPQPETNPISDKIKAVKLKLLAEKYKLVAGCNHVLFTEYHSVRSGHAPKLNEFLDALATLQSIAIQEITLELDTNNLSWDELREIIDNPVQESFNIISSTEPPEVVPVSPFPSEEPLKDPSPTDPQPSNE